MEAPLTMGDRAVENIVRAARRKFYPENRTRRMLPDGYRQMGNLINQLHYPIQTGYVPGRRYLFDALPDGAWRGQPCFIVGGGPSLEGFDFECLRGHRVIAVNRAYEDLPFADILFAIDPQYYQWCRTAKVGNDSKEQNEIFKKWTLFAGFKIWLDTNRTNIGDIYLLPHGPLYENPPYKNTMKDGIATYNFSGPAAVNLAMCLEANPIYLLGFDCQHEDKKTHYHNGYKSTANEIQLKQLALDFGKLKKKTDALGFRIVNLSINSLITAFPKDHIQNVLPTLRKQTERKWRVISFYTKGTSYETEIKKLEASLEKFSIPYHFYSCRQYGSWRANLNCKSASILTALKKYPNEDIVFLDADAIVRQYPELFDKLTYSGLHDMAAHFHIYLQSVSGGSLLSGTLWFKNHERTIELIKLWHQIGLEYPEVRHQHCLRLAIEQWRKSGHKINIFRMPSSYTCIFDYRANKHVIPVIEHFQASRKLKHEVGKSHLMDSNFLQIPKRDNLMGKPC